MGAGVTGRLGRSTSVGKSVTRMPMGPWSIVFQLDGSVPGLGPPEITCTLAFLPC